ncbi:TPA: hypothetical protein EYN09_15515 [Candidatus Poribacteria bacterium]|nr:hypothetical protein [Candidatus Poribacteria bacterium]
MRVERLENNPIIVPYMDERMGRNINGPSLIQVPEWVEKPLGRYYLYFACHNGKYIRLAYADELTADWQTYELGTLKLEDSFCQRHLASPDVHIDYASQEIIMYYHGPVHDAENQQSKVAVSKDGIHFTAFPENLGNSYFKVFWWNDYVYALAMPGVFYRSQNGRTNFQLGPTLFSENMRHSAIQLDGSRLTVFYSNKLDCPERILCSTIDLTLDWMDWQPSPAETVLEPETAYEGADLVLKPSESGKIENRVRQLRDPCIYREGDDIYLLYSIAGEYGIAIAKLIETWV